MADVLNGIDAEMMHVRATHQFFFILVLDGEASLLASLGEHVVFHYAVHGASEQATKYSRSHFAVIWLKLVQFYFEAINIGKCARAALTYSNSVRSKLFL